MSHLWGDRSPRAEPKRRRVSPSGAERPNMHNVMRGLDTSIPFLSCSSLLGNSGPNTTKQGRKNTHKRTNNWQNTGRKEEMGKSYQIEKTKNKNPRGRIQRMKKYKTKGKERIFRAKQHNRIETRRHITVLLSPLTNQRPTSSKYQRTLTGLVRRRGNKENRRICSSYMIRQ